MGVFQEGIGAPEDGKLYADSQMREIVSTFRSWDKDGDGTITCDELSRVLRTLNPSLGEKSTSLLMTEIDLNGDGVVDIHEFVTWLSGENKKKKKKMKKKLKKEQEARIALAME